MTSGEIRLAGVVVSRPGLTLPPEKRRIGMVFQDYALFPHLDISDNIGFGLRSLAEKEKRARVRGSSPYLIFECSTLLLRATARNRPNCSAA